jgi:low affinity Fe/Cu permease
MTADIWIDLMLIALLCVVATQNMSIRDQLKDLQAKLERRA